MARSKPVLFSVAGSKKAGKTTTIEILTAFLVKQGLVVAAIKHVDEADFTIDTKGKDTWRYAQAGASLIIAVADKEVSTIEKVHSGRISLTKLLDKCRESDVVFLEGFQRLVARDKRFIKIVTVKSIQDADRALTLFDPIAALVGSFSMKEARWQIPYFDASEDAKKIADLVERIVRKRHAT